MNDQDLDRRVAAAAPVRDQDLASLSLPGARDLREAIMSTSVLDTIGTSATPPFDGGGADGPDGSVPSDGDRRSWRPLRRMALAVAVAAAVVVGVVVVQSPSDHAHAAWAAPLVRFAERSPRLLITADGWTITRADELDEQNGEMTFRNGPAQVEVTWRPAAQHDGYVDDRAHDGHEIAPVTIAGHRARLFLYDGTSGDFTALWLQDGHSVELRGGFAREQGYRAMAASVRAVDVDTWLSAMPASVVKPSSRAAAVRQMLVGVPVPSSVDVAALEASSNISDHYQLGAHVIGAVACGWIEQWVSAKQAGDAAKVKEAADAMETSHHWAVLKTMEADGEYGEFVWEFADAMAFGKPGFAGPLDIAGTYRDSLGCR